MISHQISIHDRLLFLGKLVLLESMGKPSITAVVASAELIMRGLLSLFAFMKLLLNHPKSSDEDVSGALMTDSFFAYRINCSIIRIACNV